MESLLCHLSISRRTTLHLSAVDSSKAASDEIINLKDMDLSNDNAIVVVKHGDGVSVEIGKGSRPEATLIQVSIQGSAFIDGSRIL